MFETQIHWWIQHHFHNLLRRHIHQWMIGQCPQKQLEKKDISHATVCLWCPASLMCIVPVIREAMEEILPQLSHTWRDVMKWVRAPFNSIRTISRKKKRQTTTKHWVQNLCKGSPRSPAWKSFGSTRIYLFWTTSLACPWRDTWMRLREF